VVTLAASGEGGLVLAPDGAVGGTISDDDPLFWIAGAAALPARAVWDREVRPDLLQTLLAKLPAGDAPRAGLAGAAPPPTPPACYAAPEDVKRRLLSASTPDERSISFCLGDDPLRAEGRQLPACFLLELASGTFRPRAPTAHEVLELAAPPATTVEAAGTQVKVCRAGACRALTVSGPVELDMGQAAVSADGSLFAAITDQVGTAPDAKESGHAAVYDVATGRLLRRLAIGGGSASISFVADTLVVTNTPCAGPCSTSWLVDPRTGKRLGAVGGADFNTSSLDPVPVKGDVWAFNEDDVLGEVDRFVFQDLKTGRIVHRLERSAACPDDSLDKTGCGVRMVHAGDGVALLGAGRNAGDITLLDARGATIARYRAPICK